MSRQSLRAALASRAPGNGAVAPLIGRHAARLEQVSETQFLNDPEIQARCLRHAQALYGTDAVTLGAAGATLANAARECGAPASPADPEEVIGQPAIKAEIEAMGRLRPVLGERAGIAVAFPDGQLLARQLGDWANAAWCAGLLMRAVRLYGELEPDLVITLGKSGGEPRLGALCDHFGAAYVHPGAEPGVIAPPGARFIDSVGEGTQGWLYTTSDEIPAATDPAEMKEAIERLRGRIGGAMK